MVILRTLILGVGLILLSLQDLRAEGGLKLSILLEEGHPQPVVGEMMRVVIRAVYDSKVANEKLEISPTDAFDWIQTHPDDWHEERIDGLPKIVMERRLALWPKRSGPLQFGPARHNLTIIDTQSKRQEAVVTAKPLHVSVGEFPALHGWHLAAEQIELTDELSTDPSHLADGEVVTRVVTLRAKGSLPEHLPPRPVVSENWLITFAAPVERELFLTKDGPVAEVRWAWQFRPHTGEPGVLEPVDIPFYNTSARRLDRVTIPGLTIGYASFYTGQVPTGRIGAGQTAMLAAMIIAGLLAGLGVAALRLAPERTGQGLRRLRARYSPMVHFARWRAARRGDFLTLRRIAEETAAPEALQKRLDQRIYGRPEGP